MPISQLPDEGGADCCGDEAGGVEGGDGTLGEVFLVFVEGVDVGALYSQGVWFGRGR